MDGLDCPFVIVSSPDMATLADSVVELLQERGLEIPHYEVEYTAFANGEIEPYIPHTIRRQHVFFMHSFSPNEPHADIMKMLMVNDAMMRANVGGITVVAPYLPYLRQDRKAKPRVPITAKLFADLLTQNKRVEGLITIDLHTEAEEGFYPIPVDHLPSRSLFAKHIRNNILRGNLDNVLVVAPDTGSAKRNRKFAVKLNNALMAIFDKDRPGKNKTKIMGKTGASIQGVDAVIYDDIADTAGTACDTADALMSEGAKSVTIAATHGLLNGSAIERLSKSGHRVVVSDSIPRNTELAKEHSWLSVVSTAPLIANAIYQNTLVGGSISRLTE
ncbi:MAG: ribose-phosphate pyrophosphokinae [Parcubacteria group bacterium]|nr:ribose-phosphate pyrophosphokinae [Parcubacteria group bacterium]